MILDLKFINNKVIDRIDNSNFLYFKSTFEVIP
jgi:hypothetical protein